MMLYGSSGPTPAFGGGESGAATMASLQLVHPERRFSPVKKRRSARIESREPTASTVSANSGEATRAALSESDRSDASPGPRNSVESGTATAPVFAATQ